MFLRLVSRCFCHFCVTEDRLFLIADFYFIRTCRLHTHIFQQEEGALICSFFRNLRFRIIQVTKNNRTR